VVYWLAAAPGGRDGYFEVVLGVFLPDEVGQGTRPEAVVQGCVFFAGFTGNYAGDGFASVEKWYICLNIITISAAEQKTELLNSKASLFSLFCHSGAQRRIRPFYSSRRGGS
jgi:hypothetical protein